MIFKLWDVYGTPITMYINVGK